MKTRIITGSFSALSFEARLKAVQPLLEEHELQAVATHAAAPRQQVEPALRAPGSFCPAPLFVVGAKITRAMKLDCEAYGGGLTGALESSLVRQRLVPRPRPAVLQPPAGLASQPAGGPDFYKPFHDDESAYH